MTVGSQFGRTIANASSVAILIAMMGCRGDQRSHPVPETPMPPKTVLLAQMMRELSDKPGFTEAFIAQIDKSGKNGPAAMTPPLITRLRELILGKDWQRLDRFPGWTMREINPTVRVVGHFAGKDAALEGMSERHPGASASAKETQTKLKEFIDLGDHSLEKKETISLDERSHLPGFSSKGLVSALGDGVVRGDDANPAIAPLHAESQRLADVLNRLAMNGVEGSAPAVVTISGKSVKTPEELIGALMQSGHDVLVSDARYFANFGHFHYQGKDVMMPFWVNSEIVVPGTHRPLLVPVSHAEYEWTVSGPKINARVSWYYGVDGKAEFRVMDTLDQAWVLGRHAHEYRDADALEVTRLIGLFTIAYAHQHIARPAMPFGGYYGLGVCQDTVAAIEKKMTGKATLFPNTADSSLFDDPNDAEVNRLIAAIPKDRAGSLPEPERIFGSLPTDDLSAITIPGLSADLIAAHQAWHDGKLQRTTSWRHRAFMALLWFLGVVALVTAVFKARKRLHAT
ncbi:hypothetical protein HDF16_003165 [Granulicella aggregans]|uniref:Uncharacterized protein n=1 Tax=Granulicella aggregans TaxID=474949 RepID=A0A7W7ZFP3_9BACT|nr:hypothetical protein [Granulicella aggregans]MBB5058451.1 hypothetical protein [Granulicella aggregans]